jgi:hypothetical protein
VIDVDPGPGVDNRTISFIAYRNEGLASDDRLPFNDSGLITYGLSFTDGSSGLFVSSIPVPEPSGLLTMAGAFTIARCRMELRGSRKKGKRNGRKTASE